MDLPPHEDVHRPALKARLPAFLERLRTPAQALILFAAALTATSTTGSPSDLAADGDDNEDSARDDDEGFAGGDERNG